MYTKRIQLTNYGPVENLDIEFPFDGETPKPVVLVGENGSGKSIVLSHIVNGLIAAKDIAYAETPEVEPGKVYKLRSSSYIKPGNEYYFSRVDFDGAFFISEIRTQRNKKEYPDVPAGILGTVAEAMWEKMEPEKNDHYDSNIDGTAEAIKKAEETFAKGCILYFPFNRYEEPAWLNEENLKAQAQHMERKHLSGHTNRRVITASPLHENQNWLFDVIFDRSVFELQTHRENSPDAADGDVTPPRTVLLGYSGNATKTYATVLEIVRKIMRNPSIRFGIGRRGSRAVSVISEVGSISSQLVPDIFQLSSGETSLLNLFVSVLRDFDLSGTPFSHAIDVRGIVVIDEIDLHLHATHQFEVLPELIKMFPKVQFVVTTHSPLFVLGMQRFLGIDGFSLYRLPQGQQISPEEFSEFGDAYQAFASTRKFNDDFKKLIDESQRPIEFLEGTTDCTYINRAATLLGRESVLKRLDLRFGGGKGKLAKRWKDSVLPLTEILPHQVLLLFDCDTDRRPDKKGKLLQRSIPLKALNPIETGIENLFEKSTLEMARKHKMAFFSTEEEHGGTDEGGQPVTIPERWSVNESEKANLCAWLCEYGTPEDFEHFHSVIDLIEVALDSEVPDPSGTESETAT